MLVIADSFLTMNTNVVECVILQFVFDNSNFSLRDGFCYESIRILIENY